MTPELSTVVFRAKNVAMSRSKLVRVLAASVAFVALAIFQITVDRKPGSHAISWMSLVFFGGGGFIVGLTALIPPRPALRLDAAGLTFLQRWPALKRLPLMGRAFGDDATFRWADITSLTIVGPRELRSVSDASVVMVGVDASSASSPAGKLQLAMRRKVLDLFGGFPTPSGLEIPASDLLPLLERYRSSANGDDASGKRGFAIGGAD